MEVTLLALCLVAGLALIAVATVASLVAARRREDVARRKHLDATAKGALPPSLHPRIDPDKCIGSGGCTSVCPEVDVLALVDGKATVVNPTACIGHGACMRACPVDAISLVLGHEKRGVDIPMVHPDFQTNVPGIYVVGELGGMGLVYNAMTQALQCVDGLRKGLPAPREGVHQLLVVGAGPAGLAASCAAKAHGIDYVCLDQESIGGTVLHYPRHKIVMTRPVSLPGYGKLHVTEVKKEDLLAKWQDILAKTGVTVRSGVRVDGIGKVDDVFVARTSEGEVRAHRVILAMGRRGTPRKLGVPGEDLGKVVYRLLEPERYAGSRCLVAGGGDAAVEAAMALGESGATVHLLHRGKVFDRIKAKNQEKLDAAVAKGQVTLLLDGSTRAIHPDKVELVVGGEPTELPNDYVLVFIGGVLPTKFLQDCGVDVRTFKGEVYAPAN